MSRKENRKSMAFYALLAMLMLLLCHCKGAMRMVWAQQQAAIETTEANAEKKVSFTDVRGVWISYTDFADMGLYNKSEEEFTENVDNMFRQLQADKVNTVFFHVVPCNDAIYPSKYLNYSKYMFKSAPGYDPLKILIEKSHQYKIAFHAWFNPYRKTMKTSFNPASASSINRIVNIVKEVTKNYDVDGIHFDDYFYPSNGQYKGVSTARKKSNVNKMVSRVYATVKELKPDVLFGISPAGNITYAESIGCDLETWFEEEGYIDYIVPQIYWTDDYRLSGKKYKMFTNRLNEWKELNTNDIPMIIGLALYRAGNKDSVDQGWKKRSNNIVLQIKQQQAAGCQGYVLFSSRYMTKSSAKKEMKNYRKYCKSIQ